MVDGNDDLDTKLLRVLNVLAKVLAALLESDEIFFGVGLVKRLTRRDVWSSTMHLERPCSRDNNSSIGLQSTHAALDVGEFLHTHIGTEAALSEDIANPVGRVTFFGTSKLQGDAVSKNGRVSVGDIGKWSCVNEDGGTLRTH